MEKSSVTSVLVPPRARRETRPPLDFTNVTSIDRFGLIRELARGGMGQVFLARDTKLGRRVAIKFLLRDDPTLVSRFLVEARATAQCTHENIVTIHEVGEHAGLPYMVLEYVEGKTLSQMLETRIPARTFAELIVPVVRALERAHEHGIVHRDLKPSNIVVSERGVVKVLDFGVAHWFEQAEPAAPDDTLVGTVPYMAPEQWHGVVDRASDVWAVGIMFWRALAGTHPAGTLVADRLRDRWRDLDTPLPSIGELAPQKLAPIVDRCLAMRPADRYTASTLLADLQAYLSPGLPHDRESPFRGLASFGEADAKYFFGRSAEIRSALARLEDWPLLAVIGPSGIGKSSFIHAGVVPAMRATGEWRVCAVRPGRAPVASLANALAEDAGRVTEIVSQIGTSPGVLGETLRDEAARTRRRILIVVDQLEELFTLSDDDAERETFLRALLAAADDPSAPVRVVLSMRADFLDRLAAHRALIDEISRSLYFLAAPDHENLRETVVRPAELAGHEIEDGVVDDMMTVATSRGALPLLQFAATALWERRDRARKIMTRAAYEAMGRVGGAFARHADQIAAAIPEQALLRAIMTRLVTPEGTRAVVDRAELESLGDIANVLDHLVRGRLVVVHPDPVAGATVEIVHEVLIAEWPMLVRWLEDSQATRGFVAELRTAVRQWIARGKPADLVWRGATADDALALVRRHAVDLGADERAFLAAIEREASRRRRRIVAALVAAFAILAAAFGGGAIAYVRISRAEATARTNADAAERETSRALRAEAEAEQRLAAVEEAKRLEARAEAQRRTAETAADSARADATKANAEVAMSREELQKALERAVTSAHTADSARKAAEKANEQQAATNLRLEKLLAEERARSAQLKAELDKIYSGKLE